MAREGPNRRLLGRHPNVRLWSLRFVPALYEITGKQACLARGREDNLVVRHSVAWSQLCNSWHAALLRSSGQACLFCGGGGGAFLFLSLHAFKFGYCISQEGPPNPHKEDWVMQLVLYV